MREFNLEILENVLLFRKIYKSILLHKYVIKWTYQMDGIMNFKNEEQFEKAKLEDVLVNVLYDKYKNLVFHGGTAIWRC